MQAVAFGHGRSSLIEIDNSGIDAGAGIREDRERIQAQDAPDGIEDEPVARGPADQSVGARTARQRVVAGTPGHEIVTRETDHVIAEVVSVQKVVVEGAGKIVDIGIGVAGSLSGVDRGIGQRGRQAACGCFVIRETAAGATEHVIVARSADERRVASPAVQKVGAADREELILLSGIVSV